MTQRRARWVLFLGIVLLVPWPMHVMEPVFAPTAHYLLLAGAVAAVVGVEGGGGPVPLLLAMFAGYALFYLALSWVVAWAVTRLVLARSSPTTRGRLVLGVLCIGLIVAVVTRGYQTPFSRLPRANLFEALS